MIDISTTNLLPQPVSGRPDTGTALQELSILSGSEFATVYYGICAPQCGIVHLQLFCTHLIPNS